MRNIIIAAVALAALTAPVAATAQTVSTEGLDPSRPVNIYIDNRGLCFGGRIGEMRANVGRMVANQEARKLRKAGFKVNVIPLDAGIDRTAADINARIFTATC